MFIIPHPNWTDKINILKLIFVASGSRGYRRRLSCWRGRGRKNLFRCGLGYHSLLRRRRRRICLLRLLSYRAPDKPRCHGQQYQQHCCNQDFHLGIHTLSIARSTVKLNVQKSKIISDIVKKFDRNLLSGLFQRLNRFCNEVLDLKATIYT